MTHVTVSLADAVTELVNAKTDWLIPFTARRRYAPHRNTAETKEHEITVIPVRMNEQEVLNRGRGSDQQVLEVHTIGICLQVVVNSKDDNAAIDPWSDAIQEIVDWLRTEHRKIESSGWKANYRTGELVIVGESLRLHSVFAGYGFIDYRVFR